jgi:O-methyltransferase
MTTVEWRERTASAEAADHIEHAGGVERPRFRWEVDQVFQQLYEGSVRASGTPYSPRRPRRYYQLLQLLAATHGLPGAVAECGCWKGLSALLICRQSRMLDPAFDESKLHLFDSFQGLSAPSQVDGTRAREGEFRAGLDQVRRTLADFPHVSLHPGWIPESLTGDTEPSYRFVHLDLDLHEPTAAALAHFHTRLVPGGAIVVDDFGSLEWPGVEAAVESFARDRDTPVVRLVTGQAVVFKR